MLHRYSLDFEQKCAEIDEYITFKNYYFGIPKDISQQLTLNTFLYQLLESHPCYSVPTHHKVFSFSLNTKKPCVHFSLPPLSHSH